MLSRFLHPLFLAALLPLAAPAQQSTPAALQTVKLLTIGNSFAGNATAYLSKFAEADGRKLILYPVNLPGHSLEQHASYIRAYEADPKDRKGRPYRNPRTNKDADLSLREALEADQWDYVTIQQASIKSFDASTYEPFAGEIIAYIRKYAPQAEIIVHETWAYREDDPLFTKKADYTQERMYTELRHAYRQLAGQYKLRIIPVGDAFQIARAQQKFSFPDPEFDYKSPAVDTVPKQPGSLNMGWHWEKQPSGKKVFKLDGNHANNAGRYLAGAVFYEVLFGASVVENSFVPADLTGAEAKRLREAAHQAVAEEKARL